MMGHRQTSGAWVGCWELIQLNCHCSTHSARRPILKSCIFVPSEYVFKLLVGRLEFFLSCTKIKFEIDPQTTEFSKKKKNGKNNDKVITVKKLSSLENFRQSIGIF